MPSKRVPIFSVSALFLAACSSPAPDALGDDSGSGDDGGVVTTPADDSSTTTTPATVDAAPETPALPSYPAGAYGLTVRKIFPNIKLHLMKDSTGPFVDVQLSDYYDPDGKKGITAIWLGATALWCPHCQTEARAMPSAYKNDYKARGARIISMMVQDLTGAQAVEANARTWIANFHTNYDMGIDPLYQLFVYPHPSDLAGLRTALGATHVGFPTSYVINPRSMTIYAVIPGGNDYIAACTSDKNCCNAAAGCASGDQDYFCEPVTGLCTGVTDPGPFPSLDTLIQINKGPAGPAWPPGH